MTVETTPTRIRSSAGEQAKSLAGYLNEVRGDPAECRTVSQVINPLDFDATAILEHLQRRRQFPLVIFENPINRHGQPSEFPLVMNMWATRERCAEQVGLPRSKAGAELGTLFAGIVKKPVPPRIVESGMAPIHENVRCGDAADMWTFPVVRHSEMDLAGGAFTMALCMKAPDQEFYNITFVKVFPETGRRAGVTIHSQDMSRMLRLWRERGERIPTICILGHHPAFWLGTVNNIPYGEDEYHTTGAFLGEPLRITPSVTWGDKFMVPADAEIVIEGEISADERTLVDPFGEISGNYQPQELAPVFEVTAVTYRNGAIMQDIFSGHREHMLLGSIAREGSIYDHLENKIGNIKAVHLPYSGCGRYSCYISLRKVAEGQVRMAALAALSHVPYLHIVVVVDEDIDVFDEEQVIWAMGTYVDPARDIDLIKYLRPPNDTKALDASRVIFDATRPTHIPFSPRLRVPDEAMQRVHIDELLDPAERGEEGL
jgi:2,5-furandicarboxylate decarboxylase 1